MRRSLTLVLLLLSSAAWAEETPLAELFADRMDGEITELAEPADLTALAVPDELTELASPVVELAPLPVEELESLPLPPILRRGGRGDPLAREARRNYAPEPETQAEPAPPVAGPVEAPKLGGLFDPLLPILVTQEAAPSDLTSVTLPGPAAPSSAAELPLDEKTITNFLRAFPKLMRELADKAEDEDAGRDPGMFRDGTLMGMAFFMEKSPAHEDYEEIATDNGFASLREWAAIGNRIIEAHVANRKAMENAQLVTLFPHLAAGIRDNPNLSEAQKEEVLGQMNKELQQHLVPIPDTPDRAATLPLFAKISQTLKAAEEK